ncbi:uncharacterized protein Bfra_008842 [Botrytis fragariae]|uniref:Uncharacterized protein n=1 Tax=Botrytis fragariae TaxID=1964551 RepID=A0A8H6EGY6_9HELO|nr:uncharacterized protein Bfra_008842 [Botrytis fragariae]KAF5871818.1 hypothetical protein Bfra_008842 [Botrytis fragariae]
MSEMTSIIFNGTSLINGTSILINPTIQYHIYSTTIKGDIIINGTEYVCRKDIATVTAMITMVGVAFCTLVQQVIIVFVLYALLRAKNRLREDRKTFQTILSNRVSYSSGYQLDTSCIKHPSNQLFPVEENEETRNHLVQLKQEETASIDFAYHRGDLEKKRNQE